MVFHNRDDAYRPVHPSTPNIMNGFWPEAQDDIVFQRPIEERSGLFYRTDVPTDIASAEERLLDGNGTFQDFQYWVDKGWKAEHGTWPAVERFKDKLYEELQEFQVEVMYRPKDEIDPSALASEAGDVLWCAVALGSCAMAPVDVGVKNRLFRYLHGVQTIGNDGFATKPSWRDQAIKVSTLFEPLRIVDVEELLDESFEPLPSPVMNLFDPEMREDDMRGHFLNLVAKSAGLLNQIEAQFAYGGELDSDESKVMRTESNFAQYTDSIGELVAEVVLEVGWLSRETAGVSFSEIIVANIEKISGRLESNTVDKGDGARTT